jgi:FkbM family methyltransferase
LIKQWLKAFRAWQPVNAVVTTLTRQLSRLRGQEFEWAVIHLPRSGPVRSELPNGQLLRLWSRGDDWISNQVFWRGWSGYEPETTPLFFELARDAEVVIDVGAYVGFYALLAALANSRSQVIAFEPMPDNAERVRRHLRLNRLDNVELVEAAVSAVDGSAELFHLAGDHPCSTSLVRGFMPSDPSVRASVVPTIALDSLLAERNVARVSLVKLDIETAEPDAVRGMRRTLERDHPPIICEVLSDEVGAQLAASLGPLGYRLYHLTADGPVERDEIVGHPEWLNYLFATMPPSQVAAVADDARRAAATEPARRSAGPGV